MVDLDKPMLPIVTVRSLGPDPGRLVRFEVECPVHGVWVFPPDEGCSPDAGCSPEAFAVPFAIGHAGCAAAASAAIRGRAARPPARKSRLRAVSILSVQVAPMKVFDVRDLAVGPTPVEPPADVSWVKFETQSRRRRGIGI